jgi:cytochrome P450
MSDLQIDFSAPEVIDDPFPALHRLMQEDPVHWNDSLGGWCLSRYDDVAATFIDKRYSSARVAGFIKHAPGLSDDLRDALARVLTLWLVFIDPPDHTRLRKLMNKGFTVRAVERLRPTIAARVNELIDAVIDRGEMDFIADFAYPLPASVIADLLGVPREDVDDLKRWSDDLATYVLTSRLNEDRHLTAARSAKAMRDYFSALIEQRRRIPGEGIIDDLIAVRDGDDRLSEDELLASCILLLFAGHETTTQLFGNGMLALLRNPDQMEDLRRNPHLAENAVEEILRWDGPSLSMTRVLTEDVELHATTMKKGQRVYLFTAAAGRDPRHFSDPDKFDIRRENARKQINFGFGIHLCLGAQLARAEGQVALPILLERLGELRLLDDNPPWSDSVIIRGVKSLPVGFNAGKKFE